MAQINVGRRSRSSGMVTITRPALSLIAVILVAATLTPLRRLSIQYCTSVCIAKRVLRLALRRGVYFQYRNALHSRGFGSVFRIARKAELHLTPNLKGGSAQLL